jgi:surface antigen
VTKTRSGTRSRFLSGALGALVVFSFVNPTLRLMAASAPVSTQLCDGYAACSTADFTTHGYQYHDYTSYWNMDAGDECTNYAAFVESTAFHVPTPNFGLGNAGDWAANARDHGVLVNATPSVGAVAEWDPGAAGIGSYGHVGVVEQVGPGNSYIVISQQHIYSDNDGYDWQWISSGSNTWESWPDSFIHFVTPNAPSVPGYWLVSAKGNVYDFGDARFYGSERLKALPAPIVAVAATADAKGYWLVSAKGNVYDFGDARFYGSERLKALPAPIVAVARP